MREVSIPEPEQDEVLVRIRYAGVNYKEALASAGYFTPDSIDCVAGNEAVGTVAMSRCQGIREGDAVILQGRGLGTARNGTFASHVRVPGALTLPLPAGLGERDAATLGIAGHVAALSLRAMELNGLSPGAGPVAVTGASGGSGSVAIALLAGRGYGVTAFTRKADATAFLSGLGAAQVRQPPEPAELEALDLGPEIWAGAADCVGGRLLNWLLRTSRKAATVASFGLVGGAELATSVWPLILRGVRLIGISTDTDNALRREIWQQLAGPWQPPHLDRIASCISLDELPNVLGRMLRGEVRGRILVAFP